MAELGFHLMLSDASIHEFITIHAMYVFSDILKRHKINQGQECIPLNKLH